MGAVLGIMAALLLALLPGDGITEARLQTAFAAAAPEHSLLAATDRSADLRRGLYGAKGSASRHADFDDGLAPVEAITLPERIEAAAEAPRVLLAEAQAPDRWHPSAHPRGPPQA